MTQAPKVSVLILTHDEALHVERAIESVLSFSRDIHVVDSYSRDGTQQLAKALGAQVVENPFVNHAHQVNWALDHCPFQGEWILRLDADEYVTPALAREIRDRLATLPRNVQGVDLTRRMIFMGRWIRYGGYYPFAFLRLWRRGAARCEERWVAEHMQLVDDGEIVRFENDFVDENLGTLSDWIAKHDRYATRHAFELLGRQRGLFHDRDVRLTGQARRRRWLREHVYERLPWFLRAPSYFLFSYGLRAGFLDGVEGLIFHAFHGFWYRFLIDARVRDIERRAATTGRTIEEVMLEDYGLPL